MSVSDAGHVRNDDATADEALANGGRMGSQRLVLCPDRLARRLPRANAKTEATPRPKSTWSFLAQALAALLCRNHF